jgi:uncharacterized membrane protein
MTSQLIVITYPSPDDAERVVNTARRLESEHLLDLADIEYVTRDKKGVVAVYESVNRPLAGAALGAFWGALLGRVFGAPLLGAGIGAASGALVRNWVDDDGIDEGFRRELTTKLPPGSSAVFALVRRSTPDKVLSELGKFGGTVLHTSFSEDIEEQLQAALDEGHRKASTLRSATLGSNPSRPRRVVHHR